jgi:hypothetical protein
MVEMGLAAACLAVGLFMGTVSCFYYQSDCLDAKDFLSTNFRLFGITLFLPEILAVYVEWIRAVRI